LSDLVILVGPLYQMGERTMADNELLTAGKLATAWGVSPKLVKQAIEKAGVEADVVKGGCKYYGPETAEKIKKEL
jgi:hypothetical protein